MIIRKMVALLCLLFLFGCASRSETIRAQHPEWDEDTIGMLAGRNVQPGMTRDMVKAALGNPESVSREGNEEVWGYAYYEKMGEKVREEFVFFVYLKGDKVARTRGDTTRLQSIS